jgi:hypothetical protein
MERLDA